MDIQRTTVSEFKAGQLTVSGEHRLPAYPCLKGVTLKASGSISVNGYAMGDGETITIPIDDPTKLAISGSGTISWLVV